MTADMMNGPAFKRLRLENLDDCARVEVNGHGPRGDMSTKIYVFPGNVNDCPAQVNPLIVERNATPPPLIVEAQPIDNIRTAPFSPDMYKRGLKVRALYGDRYYPAYLFGNPNGDEFTVYWDEDKALISRVRSEDILVDYGSIAPSYTTSSVVMGYDPGCRYPTPSVSRHEKNEFFQIRGLSDRMLGPHVDAQFYEARASDEVARPLEWEIVEMLHVVNPVNQALFQKRCDALRQQRPAEFQKIWAFHGYNPANEASLLTHGLLNFQHPLLPENVEQTDVGWFGSSATGVYVARSPEYCVTYANSTREKPKEGMEVRVLALRAGIARGYRFEEIVQNRRTLPDETCDHGISKNGHELWLPYAHQANIRYSVLAFITCVSSPLPNLEN